MSKLNGKKPFRGKHYQRKVDGKIFKVVDWNEERDDVVLETEYGQLTTFLSTFYDYFGRIKDYEPPYRSELENK